MKRTLIFALAVLMMLSAFAACKKTSESNTPASDADLPKTLGDIFAIKSVNIAGYQSSGKAVAIVYQVDGSYWRAIAPMTEEQSEAWFAVDLFDENKEEKERAILSPLEIVQLDNLDKEKLSKEDLKAYVGKTGEELLTPDGRPRAEIPPSRSPICHTARSCIPSRLNRERSTWNPTILSWRRSFVR